MKIERGAEQKRTAMTFRGVSTIALVMMAVLITGCGNRSDNDNQDIARSVQLSEVRAWDGADIREFFGRVEQTVISPLAFEVPGRVVDIAVRDGVTVKRGQLIAKLDAEPYELQLRRAEVQYRQLASDLQRKRQLRDERILSQGAFEQLEAGVAMAKVQADLARRDLRNSRLVAPFDGRISMRSIERQQMVQAGVPVFNLENVGRFDIGVDLPQSLVQSLSFNSDLHALAWLPEQPDQTFPLVYREHATQSAPVSGVYRLVFSGERPEGASLLAGMAVRVRIVSGTADSGHAGAFAVPLASLNVKADGSYQVWHQNRDDGRVRAVPVQVKEIKGDRVLISGELRAGERVVATGSRFLTEGMKVTDMGGQ